MKKTRMISWLMPLLVMPFTVWLGSRLPGRWYYLTSTLLIFEAMLPFFLRFEARRPQARELVSLAVVCALAAVSRVAFAFLPSFKPITGIVMIAGIAFGPEAGFLTGAVSAFASNFFYSQGPWTPWQMMSYGAGGFVAGLVFRQRQQIRHPAVLAGVGFVIIMLLVGPILDCSTIFTSLTTITWEAVVLILVRGIVYNVPHGISCGLTLLLLGRPMLEKLNRLKTKYGMMDAGKDGRKSG